MAGESLIIGNGNWGVKSGNLLGYNLNGGNYVPRELTFTRATTATRTNGALLVESTPLSTPRIDYSTGTAALLMEPQRTNLQLNSENFSVMGQLSVTTTVNQIEAPSGLITADLITELATTATHGVFNNAACSVVSGTVYTLSCYFKKGPGATAPDIVQISSPQGFSGFYANFNITTGVVTQSFGVTSTAITSVGNGWWRCSFTATASSTAGFSGLAISLTNNNPTSGISPSYLGQTTSNIYVWGAQVEAGSFATSYIPTTSASVTRNADASTTSGMNTFIGQTEGTIVLDINNINENSDWLTLNPISGSSYTNGIGLGLYATAIRVQIYSSGGNAFITVSPISGRNKIALAYKSGDIALYINGVQVGTSSATFSFGVLLDGITAASSSWLAGVLSNLKLYSAALYKTRLTNAELITLTK